MPTGASGWGSGDHTESACCVVEEEQNDTPERRPSPSWPQRRSAPTRAIVTGSQGEYAPEEYAPPPVDRLAIVPILLGNGERLFDRLDGGPAGYECVEFISSFSVVHARFARISLQRRHQHLWMRRSRSALRRFHPQRFHPRALRMAALGRRVKVVPEWTGGFGTAYRSRGRGRPAGVNGAGTAPFLSSGEITDIGGDAVHVPECRGEHPHQAHGRRSLVVAGQGQTGVFTGLLQEVVEKGGRHLDVVGGGHRVEVGIVQLALHGPDRCRLQLSDPLGSCR